jgi:two-component system response regulator AtoC
MKVTSSDTASPYVSSATARPVLVAPAAVAVAPVPEPFSATQGLSLKEISRRAVLQAERDVIGRALEQCRWNRVKTARMLKISYRALLYKIKDMGFKQDPAAS